MKKQFKRKTTADIQKMVTDIVIEGLEKEFVLGLSLGRVLPSVEHLKTTIPRESIMHLTR